MGADNASALAWQGRHSRQGSAQEQWDVGKNFSMISKVEGNQVQQTGVNTSNTA